MKQMQEEAERMKMRGKAAAEANPWAVDYNSELATRGKEGEALLDKAKSWSF